MRRKLISMLCASAIALSMMSVTGFAAFNSDWSDGNPATGRIEGEFAANILKTNGTSVEQVRGSASGGKTLRFNDTYNPDNQPYVIYEIFAEKSGIYEMHARTSIHATSAKGQCDLFSPYTITINNSDTFSFEGAAQARISQFYKYGAASGEIFAGYNAPVYLEAGKNEIKFTITGASKNGGGKYLFEIDFFTFEYKEDNTEFVKVSAENAIGGSKLGGYAPAANEKADGGSYYQINSTEVANGEKLDDTYLDYIVNAPHTGEYVLEFAASHPRQYLSPMSIVINGDVENRIKNYDESKIENGYATNAPNTYNPDLVGEVLTANDFWKFTTKKTVTLNKGINKVRVKADYPRKNGEQDQYLFYLDYLKFTPVATGPVEGESGTPVGCKEWEPVSGASGGKFMRFSANASTTPVASSTYTIIAPVEGRYDVYFDMAGYIDAIDANSSFAPIKFKVDENDAVRLNTAGNFITEKGGTADTALEATVTKEGSIDIDDSNGNFNGKFARYKLIDGIELTKGSHTISFIADAVVNNTHMYFALDKFELVPVSGQELESVSLNIQNQTIATTETANATISLIDINNTMMSSDNAAVTYTSSKPGVASVSEDGTITAHNPGKTLITATVDGKEDTKAVYVYDAANPFVIINAAIKEGVVDVETAVGSAVGDAGLTTVPILIAAEYNPSGGLKTTLDNLVTAEMNVNKNTADTGSNPVVRHTVIDIADSYENVDIFAWDSLEGLGSMFSITEAIKEK